MKEVSVKRPCDKEFKCCNDSEIGNAVPGTVISFNAENWTGETISITIIDNMTFKMNELGYSFVLKPFSEGYRVYSADGGWDSDYDMCTLYAPILDDKYWVAMSGDLVRESCFPMIAAACVFANTI